MDVTDRVGRSGTAAGRGWLAVLVCLGLSGAGGAVAQEKPDGSDGSSGAEGPCEVGLVALDDSARSGSLANSVSELVGRSDCDVVAGVELRKRLEERQSPAPASKTASKFSGIGSTVSAGVKDFFYKGNDAAVAKLKPVFEMGVENLTVLARRPDYADQVYHAGIILVRAYLKMNEEGEAGKVADRLVTLFPSRRPSTETVPPNAVEFIAKRRRALEEGGTQLKVLKLDRARCKAFINGIPADEKAYPASSRQRYHLTMDCGSASGPVWSIKPTEGALAEAPVTDAHPFDYEMKSANFESRTRAEGILRNVAYWAGLNHVLGVSSKGVGEESFLVVRQEKTGGAIWSDATDPRAIGRVLSKVWPEQADAAGGAWEEPVTPLGAGNGASGGGGRKTVGFILGGTGLALTGGSLAYYFLGPVKYRKRMECTSASVGDPNLGPGAAGCEGIDPFESYPESGTQEEQEAWVAESNATADRAEILAWTGVGLGAAALTTGVVLLVTGPESPGQGARADKPAFYVAPGPTRRGAAFGIRF